MYTTQRRRRFFVILGSGLLLVAFAALALRLLRHPGVKTTRDTDNSLQKPTVRIDFVFSDATLADADTAGTQPSECESSVDEVAVYRSQLSRDASEKRILVVMPTTRRWIDDIDSFNLPLAVQGHAIPPDVLADFTKKNKTGCMIQPFGGVRNLRFMSRSEEEKLLARDWSEFDRNYGKEAERVAVSRVGFSSDKSLALLHILYSSSGELYLLERKNGKWLVKFSVQTMAS